METRPAAKKYLAERKHRRQPTDERGPDVPEASFTIRIQQLQRGLGNAQFASLMTSPSKSEQLAERRPPTPWDLSPEPTTRSMPSLVSAWPLNRQSDDSAKDEPLVPDTDWIDRLPSFVTAQIDAFSQDYFDKQPPAKQQKLLDKRAQNRNTFIVNMRPYLGSDAAIEAHFNDVKAIPGTDLWGHVSTRERLLDVKADLEAEGSPMPSTSVGQALRGRHLHPAGKDPGAGMMTHALGFAVDWKAYAAPHVKDPRLHTLFEAVTGGPAAMHLKLGSKALGWTARHDLIEQIGKGEADPERERLLMASIESEYDRLRKASDEFKISLPEGSLAQLKAVETARDSIAAAAKELKTAKKTARRNPAAVETAAAKLAGAKASFEAAKQSAKPQLESIFGPWLDRIRVRIDDINNAARERGVDLDNDITSQATLRDLQKQVSALDKKERPHERVVRSALAEILRVEREVQRIVARIRGVQAWLAAPPTKHRPSTEDLESWSRDVQTAADSAQAVLEALSPVKTEIARLLPAAKLDVPEVKTGRSTKPDDRQIAAWQKSLAGAPARIDAAAGKLAGVSEPLGALLAEERTTAEDLTARRGKNEAVSKRLGKSELAALQAEKVRLFHLRRTAEALKGDLDFVFNSRAVADPAITQLLGLMSGTRGGGFFTPDPEAGGKAAAEKGEWSSGHGYNLKFFKAMVRHGFELGVAWEQSPDTMHFELVEGRRLAESGGTREMKAGTRLKSQEAATSP